jgi:hypothetical protein
MPSDYLNHKDWTPPSRKMTSVGGLLPVSKGLDSPPCRLSMSELASLALLDRIGLARVKLLLDMVNADSKK